MTDIISEIYKMSHPNTSNELLQSFEQRSISSFNSSFDSTITDTSLSPLCSPTRNSLRNEGVYDEEEEEIGYNDLFNKTEKELREQSFEYEEPPIPYDEPKDIINIIQPLIKEKVNNNKLAISDDEFMLLKNDLNGKKVEPLLYKSIIEEVMKDEEDNLNDFIKQINKPYRIKEKENNEIVENVVNKIEKIIDPSMNRIENILDPIINEENKIDSEKLMENDKLVKDIGEVLMNELLEEFVKELIQRK